VVLGLDDATLVGAPRKMVMGSWESLREPDSIVIDRAGYQLLFPGEPLELERRTLEMNDHRVRVVGISEASAPFATFPIIHARYSDGAEFSWDANEARWRLCWCGGAWGFLGRTGASDREGTGLKARTTDEFRWDCIRYYLENTGIPVNFGITIAIALIVGLVVSGQTFYLFTVENLRQFGALKAIGVTNLRLVGMILLQAFTVGFIGYALGTAWRRPSSRSSERRRPRGGLCCSGRVRPGWRC
jgi:putative ABC transport system permease protein